MERKLARSIPESTKSRRYLKWHGLLARVERCDLTRTIEITITDYTCFVSEKFSINRSHLFSHELRKAAMWINSSRERLERIKEKHLDKYEAKYGK